MQKKILLIAVYFTFAGACVNAQSKDNIASPPPPPAAPVSIDNLVVPPPPPPPPPIPPPPPGHPIESKSAVIVNSHGYDVSVQIINGKGMVFLEKDDVKQKIKLSTWNANRKFYEKKYGQLPAIPADPLQEKDDSNRDE